MAYPQNWQDGDVLYAADLKANIFKGGLTDQVGGSSSTGLNYEKVIGIVKVTANLITNGFLIGASGNTYFGWRSGGNVATIRLRCGSASNGTANHLLKVITRANNFLSTNYGTYDGPWSFNYFVSPYILTSANVVTSVTSYIVITGQMTHTSSTVACESIEAIYL